jgi:hypothetical protein
MYDLERQHKPGGGGALQKFWGHVKDWHGEQQRTPGGRWLAPCGW